jgi:NTP pyrophosphatase (non-canonical NTP hydrolase)
VKSLTQKDVCQKAVDTYGSIAQKIKCIEELGELVKAMSKHMNNPNKSNNENVCEEIADVEIMLHQMRLLFDSSAIDQYKRDKLDRLEQRLSS